ncbi:MAG: PDZ domain-containing protein [Phycisphaeraceae bacterium]|nr:PDZ domain-containing protein [Phycisphaeraceae bacterium]
MNLRRPSTTWTRALAVVLVCSAADTGWAQRRAATRDSAAIRAVLSKVAAPARRSVVSVHCDGAAMALGTVVGPKQVLTKASELFEPIEIRTADGKRHAAELVGVHRDHDLALLSTDAPGLEPVTWAPDPKAIRVGSWLAASTDPTEAGQVAMGVVSVATRDLRARGFLGVAFNTQGRGVRIERVLENTSAQRAGLQVGDRLMEIDGILINSTKRAIAEIRKYVRGSIMKLKLQRGDEQIELEVKLGPRPVFSSMRQRMMERSAGRLSDRRNDFEKVFQHDMPLAPEQCGGPVVGLEGMAVGLNIARAGRTASYAIPAAVVRPLIKPLASGDLKPDDSFELGMKRRKIDVRIWAVQKDLRRAQKKRDKHWMQKYSDELKALQAERDKLK